MKKKIFAIALSLSMLASQANALTPVATPKAQHVPALVWVVFGCSGGVVVSALFAHYLQHRQLTASEAGTCGIAYWFNPPKPR